MYKHSNYSSIDWSSEPLEKRRHTARLARFVNYVRNFHFRSPALRSLILLRKRAACRGVFRKIQRVGTADSRTEYFWRSCYQVQLSGSILTYVVEEWRKALEISRTGGASQYKSDRPLCVTKTSCSTNGDVQSSWN